MRPIKFRSWDARGKQMDIPDAIANDIDGEKYQIMQYTGLKDKNGKEIYESDIVSTGGLRCVVIWVDTRCRFELERPGKQSIPQTTSLDKAHQPQYEIVGNKYETV